MRKLQEINAFFDKLDKTFAQKILPSIIAEEATKFYKQRFTVKADVNNSPWPQAKNPPKRGSLMVRSGNLVASIRPSEVSSTRVVISAGSTKVPYAKLHNEGGAVDVPVTKKMRRFAWAMKYKTGDDRWEGLALTKRTSLRVNIPKRQFMGHSRQLDRQIISSVKTAFKSLFNRK